MAELERRESSVAPRDWFSRWFEDMPFPRWPEVWRSRFLEGIEPIRVEEFAGGQHARGEGGDAGARSRQGRRDQRQETRRYASGPSAARRPRPKRRVGTAANSTTAASCDLVPLPAGATDQDVKATYKDGILEVRIPVDQGKAENAQDPIQRT